MPPGINMTGQQIGTLLVGKYLGKSRGANIWLCSCIHCDFTQPKTTASLNSAKVRGITRTICGCWKNKGREIRRIRRNQGLEGWIYLIQYGNMDYYKIGYSRNLKERIKALQTSCPHKLRLLAKTRGGFLEENSLQRDYEDQRINNEWFKFDKKTVKKLKAIFKEGNIKLD